MQLGSINRARLFRRPSRKIALFRISTLCFQDIGRNCRPWMFVFILEFQKQRDRQNLFHFAMWLRPEFEALHSSILYCHPLPSLTEAVAEFTSKEAPLWMMSSLSALIQSISSPTLLQHRIILSLFVGHLIMDKWTEDNSLVAPQLSKFNASIANNSATWFLPAVNEKAI